MACTQSSYTMNYYKFIYSYPNPDYTWWHHYADRLDTWGLTRGQVRRLRARQVKKLYWQLKQGYAAKTQHPSRVKKHYRNATVVQIYS